MITNDKLKEKLYKTSQLYDLRNNHDYLLVFNQGKKSENKYVEISFKHINFWHLLGCKLDKGADAESIYEACKNGIDMFNDVSLCHTAEEVITKSEIFEKTFDFITKAKLIKMVYTANSPDQYTFFMAIGNENGVVGYDYPRDRKRKSNLFPKSIQNKSLSKISKNYHKIVYILSKSYGEKEYKNIEYEIKEGVSMELITELPEDILVNIARKNIDLKSEGMEAAQQAAATMEEIE